MFKVEATGQRRSARIWALEEKARELSLKKKAKSATSSNANAAGTSQIAAKRKGCKRKSLHDVVVKSLAMLTKQEGEASKRDDASIKTYHQAHLSSLRRMPSKETLEYILDVLQRRDTKEIFAEPVDPDEVSEYYTIIKEPMDFGTMRAKLQEGMYTNFKQFERDVYLITSNAMKFNASNTVYYTEARAINDLALKVFDSLKSQEEKVQLAYSRRRRRPGKKPVDEAGGSNTKLAKPGGVKDLNEPPHKRRKYLTSSCVNIDWKNKEMISGLSYGKGLNPNDRRNSYMSQSSFRRGKEPLFSAVYDNPKSFALVPNEIQYAESLKEFVKDLGRTAQRVAYEKLRKFPIEYSSCLPRNTPTSSSTNTDLLFPALFPFQGPKYQNGVDIGQRPRSSIFNSPGTYKGKMICDNGGTNIGNSIFNSPGSYKGKTVCDNEGIHINNSILNSPGSYKGMIVCDDGGMNFSNSYQAEMLAAIFGEAERTADDVHSNNILMGEKSVNTSRNLDIGGSSFKEKTTGNGDSMDLLLATFRQISAIQTRDSWTQSGLYFPVTGNEVLSNVHPSKFVGGSHSTPLITNFSGPMISLCSQSANASSVNQASSSFGIDSYYLKGKAPIIAPSPQVAPKYGSLNPSFHGFSSHNLNGERPSHAPASELDLNYWTKSSQAVQPVEWIRPSPWGMQSIYDLPNLQSQESRQQPSSLNAFMVQHPSQVASSTRENPLLFDAIKASKQIPPSQNAFMLQQSSQVAPSTREKPLLFDPIKAYKQMPSSPNAFVPQQSSHAASSAQGKPLLFDATSFLEGANPQSRPTGSSSSHFLWNTPMSSLMDNDLPDLDLQL